MAKNAKIEVEASAKSMVKVKKLLDSLSEGVDPNAGLVVKHISHEDKEGNMIGAAIILKGRHSAMVLAELDALVSDIVARLNAQQT